MSVRATVLLWAQRVIARKDAPAHQVLEIAADAGPEAAQAAFYKIALLAHPDLHRKTLPRSWSWSPPRTRARRPPIRSCAATGS